MVLGVEVLVVRGVAVDRPPRLMSRLLETIRYRLGTRLTSVSKTRKPLHVNVGGHRQEGMGRLAWWVRGNSWKG